MSRSRLIFLAVSGALVLSILSGAFFGATSAEVGDEDSLYKYLSVFTEVLRLIRQAYVDETETDILMAGAVDGAPDALDPFSAYIPEERLGGYLAARALGSRRSGVRVVKERGAAYVVAVQKGSPADEAGLRRGDIFAKLNGRVTRAMPFWEIEETLAGPNGTRIELEIVRSGESHEAALELRDFDEPVPHLERVDGVPLLRIPNFSQGVLERVSELIEQVDDDGMLVDMRGVAWGSEEAAYNVGRLFAGGALGVLLGRAGPLKHLTAEEPQWQGKLVVLVDRGSQGAAEVFAKVLQQGAGAKLVGQKTFGFAGRSRFVALKAGGSLLITEGFYTGPDLEPINEGVEPDLRVGERPRHYQEVDEPLEDLILDRAIEVLLGQEAEEVEEAA